MSGTGTERGGALKIVVVGHVDHGKSTLIGRLLHDTGSLPEGKLEELEGLSRRRGMALEWSFVLDAFQAERDQAVTIDTTQIGFKSAGRDYVIIDAPGHREFLKNMVSGAALADAAVLVVDAGEGVREQSRRHAYLLSLLGLTQVAVVVNKMDLMGHAEARFRAVEREITQYLAGLGLTPLAVVPAAARHGANLARRSAEMGWYDGPTLVEALARFAGRAAAVERPLRLPIQDVYRFDERRVLVGRVETGTLRVGDRLVFSPSNRSARVRTIEAWNETPPATVAAGRSTGFTLDEPIFVERGEVASHGQAAPKLTNVFRARLFWLSDRPLEVGRRYTLKLATATVPATVAAIERAIDTESLAGTAATAVRRDEVAEVVLRTGGLVALDEAVACPATGRFVLVDGFEVAGGGIAALDGYPDQRPAVRGTNLTAVEHLLTPQARAWRNGHRGAVLWMTGLSGAGKSTLAMQLEQLLFARGFQTYVLDGDNVRHGLNADLGFAPEDRAENIRRVGEAAALFADAGLIVITAFISPYQADRARARAAAGDAFHEIHVHADLETCEARDPKGLYKRARAGDIAQFTGVSAPYEPPEAPELTIDTAAHAPDHCVDLIAQYVERNIAIKHDVANLAE